MLQNLKDYHIVETLDGNETLYFSLPIKDSQNNDIKLEYYVQNEKNRYVLKEKHSNGDWYDYVCQLDVDDLKISSSIYASGYSFYGSAYDFCLALESDIYSISGKTWSVETDIPDGEKDVSGSDSNMLGYLTNGAEVFGAEIKIDSINKKIYFNQKIGEDKGAYFIDELNLKKIEIDSNTNDLITRLIPIGADRLTISNINGGVPYVENKTYTTKNIYASWVDERYTDAESLKADAESKLSELCKPLTTYTANIIDLASANPEYNILSYSIGDTVTLFNRKENQKQTHRIVEIDSYPEEPHRNTCQLSSKAYSIIGVQKRSFKSTDSIQGKVGITKANGDGTVSTAVAGTDYATPSQVNAKQNKITASGILKGNGSGTISAATAGTDYLAVSKTITTNGTCLKFNDGTMICYGSKLSKTTDSNGQATITYPTAFYETPAGIAMFQAVGSSKQYCNISWSNASSMTIYVLSNNAALASKSIYVNYIAIGRWK